MGTVFEELVRKFNEDNHEEAGEHWTPRDAVKLIADLSFLPIADNIESGSYLLYDCACGTGGMLTVARLAKLYGKGSEKVFARKHRGFVSIGLSSIKGSWRNPYQAKAGIT
jgi:type I restriction-modification system DNA methylase subunit